MSKKLLSSFTIAALVVALQASPLATAAEDNVTAERNLSSVTDFVGRATSAAQDLVLQGLSYLGVRYRPGGSSEETGFDCSGLVSRAFRDALGLNLPHNAAAMAKMGDVIRKDELKPGDLVFFNTMRKTFSHVGIYLGDNRFVHAPASGGAVRIDDMRESYWMSTFNGARRINSESDLRETKMR